MSSNSERCFTEICLVPKIWMARVGTICIVRGHLKTDWALVPELDDESLNNAEYLLFLSSVIAIPSLARRCCYQCF